MVHFASTLSIAEVTTAINAFISFFNFTTSLSLVIIIIYSLPKTNTAVAWSSLSRTLHTSLWPTILQTDSSSGPSRSNWTRVSGLTRTIALNTILVAVAGITLPLGVSEGQYALSDLRQVPGTYISDPSPLGLSTTPNPEVKPFPNSTSMLFANGPSDIQYRKYITQGKISSGIISTSQSVILRNELFAVEGLIVDMTQERPGVGFLNHTFPSLKHGGSWSQDILWLEPSTRCADTNLTLAYYQVEDGNPLSIDPIMANANLASYSDRPALVDNATLESLKHLPEPPSLIQPNHGQYPDLERRAYIGALTSNRFALDYLNARMANAKVLPPVGVAVGGVDPLDTYTDSIGKLSALPISFYNTSVNDDDAAIPCVGYNRLSPDVVGSGNVSVSCGAFLGLPTLYKIDDESERWTQKVFACASTTRAFIQTVTFSTTYAAPNHTTLQLTRGRIRPHVLWAQTIAWSEIMNLQDLPVWGSTYDTDKENPAFNSTVEAESFYLPPYGSPMLIYSSLGASSSVWPLVYGHKTGVIGTAMDYSGQNDFAMKRRFEDIMANNTDPAVGRAQIINLIFTDMMANNVVGTRMSTTLWVSPYKRTIEYNLIYAIPGFFLLAIWVPSFLGGLFLLLTRSVTFKGMRNVLDHTSVGRVAIGTSALRLEDGWKDEHDSDTEFGEAPQGSSQPDELLPLNNSQSPSSLDDTSGEFGETEPQPEEPFPPNDSQVTICNKNEGQSSFVRVDESGAEVHLVLDLDRGK